MRDRMICTVGTSLIANLRQSTEADFHQSLKDRNAKAIVSHLLKVRNSDRVCGAEINSIHSILRAGYLNETDVLVFLVSDTDDGCFTGQILRLYYENSRNPERFEKVDVKVVEGLTADDPQRFRNVGLRNLVRRISEVVKTPAESKRILINATGGYKVQISFAGMIGQALDIPVCYMYEGFSEVIQLPPQPISLDLTFWLDHSELFYDLDEGIETEARFEWPDSRFESLIDDVHTEGIYLTTLSPTGQLFHETFRHHFEKQPEILPKPSTTPVEKKKIRLEDKNKGKHKGLKTYLEELRLVSYVNEIYTQYYNPDLNVPRRFRKSAKVESGQVEGHFSNDGATTKFIVVVNTDKNRETLACIADLNNRLKQGLL